ncbi:MAG: PHP domain-containing protein [Nitrospinaceae bacterium]|jgi:putative hydrolase|nr:PHP domain-containing protein [Nitrospinaceae bacterium]
MRHKSLKQFNSLTPSDIAVDHHIHSNYTHGHAGIREIVKKAKQLRLFEIAITDHVRRQSTYYHEYTEEIKNAAEEYGLSVLVGFESKVIDAHGNLDLDEKCRQYADIIIGSVHSVPSNGKFISPELLKSSELQEAEHRFGLTIVKSGKCHILGHAGAFSLRLHGAFDPKYMEELIWACAKFDTAFEINSRYHADIAGWLMQQLTEYNPFVSIGSDAHNLSEVGSCLSLFMNNS